MTLRTILNAAWTLACEGVEPEGVEEMRKWLHEDPKTPEQQAEEERKQKARENKASVANLSRAFATGG